MSTVLDNEQNFSSLSIRDLLEARDLYHFHLLSKANVVGTAIGLYLIRDKEPWPTAKGEGIRSHGKKFKYERTLENSSVRDYSWPCVLVFVRNWLSDDAFLSSDAKGVVLTPADMVPKRLYMPDGRSVPVCVVKVEADIPNNDQPIVGRWPMSWLGGGHPIISNAQGVKHQATAGCLVSDGHLTYVLTSRHACGETGTPVHSRLRGGKVRIGESSNKQLTRENFTTVYPAFPQRQTFLNLDIGLVRIDDVEQWSSSVYGLPAVGPLADVYEQNLSLRLIDQPVWAFGAASGLLSGTIKAIFYRYRSVGGYDYVGDFLIAPKEGSVPTRPGDSGAIWHLDVTKDPDTKKPIPLVDRDLRPLAIEWGGQILSDGRQRTTFAVATSLSNVCKLLDVELVTDLDRGVQGYWGRVGHYSIAAFATQLLGSGKVAQLMAKNLENLSYDFATIRDESLDELIKNAHNENGFIPLADVADEVWKKSHKKTGGRDTQPTGRGTTGPEHPQHYADIDIEYHPDGHSKSNTFRAWCRQDPDKFLTVSEWKKFYAVINTQGGDHKGLFNQGILPFRVWQIFNELKAFAKAKNTAKFVAAAGILAHYVGDACQPLHGSQYADGDDRFVIDRTNTKGDTTTVKYGSGIHSAYETKMVDRHKESIVDGLTKKIKGKSHGLPLVTSGQEAAMAIIDLMEKTAKKIPPLELIDVFEELGGSSRVATLDGLWTEYGNKTIEVMEFGVRYLAMIWESAWKAGIKDVNVPSSKIVEIARDVLSDLYNDTSFLPSLTIEDIGPAL